MALARGRADKEGDAGTRADPAASVLGHHFGAPLRTRIRMSTAPAASVDRERFGGDPDSVGHAVARRTIEKQGIDHAEVAAGDEYFG